MKRDVQEYFIGMQRQYNDMLKILEKVNKEIEEGLVSDEQRQNFETYFNTIKANYDRVAYIIHLLNLPPKFIQKRRERKLIKEQEEFFKKMMVDQESIEAENKDALDNLSSELEAIDGSK